MAPKRRHSDSGDIKDIKKFTTADLEEQEVEIPAECQPQFRNYQLIGDLVSITIYNSKNPLHSIKRNRNVLCNNFTHAYWNSDDLRRALKADKKTPVARNVILSVGYKDCWEQDIGKHTLIKNIEKIVRKLRKKGCKELMITNVPPCAKVCDKIDHWKNLQFINEEIMRICSRSEDTFLCDIFEIFCSPKNLGDMLRKEKIDYVYFGEANYQIHLELYNKEYRGKDDLVTFSDVGKDKLNKRIEDAIRLRRISLRRKVPTAIIVLEDDSDDNQEEQKATKSIFIKTDSESDKDVIIIEDNDKPKCDINNVIVIDECDPIDASSPKDTKDNKNGHSFLCECEDCEREHNKLMGDFLNTLREIKEEDKKSAETEKELLVTDEMKRVFPERIVVSCEAVPKAPKVELKEDIKNFNLSDVKPEQLNDLSIEILTAVKEKLEEEIKSDKGLVHVAKSEKISVDDCWTISECKTADSKVTECENEEADLKEETFEIKPEEIMLDDNN